MKVQSITEDKRDPQMVYEPGHPDADARGYVRYPNVSVVEEMVNMIPASRAYEAGVTSIESIKGMAKTAYGTLARRVSAVSTGQRAVDQRIDAALALSPSDADRSPTPCWDARLAQSAGDIRPARRWIALRRDAHTLSGGCVPRQCMARKAGLGDRATTHRHRARSGVDGARRHGNGAGRRSE